MKRRFERLLAAMLFAVAAGHMVPVGAQAIVVPPPDYVLNADPGGGPYSLFGAASVVGEGHPGNGFSLPTLIGGNTNRQDGPYVAASLGFDARTGLTAGAWIRPDAVMNTEQAVVTKYENAPFGISWGIVLGSAGLHAYVVGDDFNAAGTQGIRHFYAPPVPAGVWSHVAFVYSGATQTGTLYINGFAQPTAGSGFSVPAIKITSTPVRVGTLFANGSYTGPTNYFGGIIDEVRLYTTALTPEQVIVAFGPFDSLPASTQAIPTLSEWGVLVLSVLLMVGAALRLRRL